MDAKDQVNIEEEIIEYKVYKEKPYLNSDKNPLGVSINGKSKEYVCAHQEIKNLLKKGKKYVINKTSIRVLDVTVNNSSTNAIMEVMEKGATKGNVELKIHAPSVHRKKGATIEMRKMSGQEYSHVTTLKNAITSLLDGFILGDEVSKVLEDLKKGSRRNCASRVTSKPKPFSCDLCD